MRRARSVSRVADLDTQVTDEKVTGTTGITGSANKLSILNSVAGKTYSLNDTGSADWHNLMGYSLRKKSPPNLPEAEKSLQWQIDNGQEEGYVALARLRLSALAMEQKNLDKAKALLQGQKAPAGFQPLFDDRLGDIAVLQNKPEDAKTLFISAYKGLEAANEYRRLIDYKLATLGVNIADIEKKQ